MYSRISSLCAAAILLLLVACTKTKSPQEYKIISGIEDLAGCVVAVPTGSVQEVYATANCPNSEIMLLETFPDACMVLEQDKADAYIGSSLTWNLEKEEFPDFVCVCDTINPIPIAFGFNKKDKVLKLQFNSFLTEFKKTDEYKKMFDDWLDPYSDRMVPEGSDEECPNGELVIATSACMMPFTFIKNGKVSGFEVEIAARFALSLGKKPVFEDMTFSSVIPYLKSGKAEMAAATLSVTPERQKSIDFSEPWTVECLALITHKRHTPQGLASGTKRPRDIFTKIKDSFYSNVIFERRYLLLLEGLGNTMLISLLAAIFGTLLGILLCWGSVSKKKIVSKSSELYIEFMRKMPQVVFLMIMFYVVFAGVDINGVIVATIAFAMCFGAYTSVIFRSSLESIDKGQREAALSVGFTPFKAFLNVILPQVVQRTLPVYKGEFIGLVKATSIVGYIAVFDLTKAGDMIRSRTYEAFFPLIIITIIYFVVIWFLTLLLKYAEVKTQPKRKKFHK